MPQTIKFSDNNRREKNNKSRTTTFVCGSYNSGSPSKQITIDWDTEYRNRQNVDCCIARCILSENVVFIRVQIEKTVLHKYYAKFDEIECLLLKDVKKRPAGRISAVFRMFSLLMEFSVSLQLDFEVQILSGQVVDSVTQFKNKKKYSYNVRSALYSVQSIYITREIAEQKKNDKILPFSNYTQQRKSFQNQKSV